METTVQHAFIERINLVQENGEIKPEEIPHKIAVQRSAPKTGILFVGWGGNNGATLTAGILANKANLSWKTRTGSKKANFFGSLTQTVTVKVGVKLDKEKKKVEDVFRPVRDIVPLVEPTELVIGGWDISAMNLYDACYRAQVLEPTLVDQLQDELSQMVPMKAVFNPDYVAANQSDRVNNVFTGTNEECVEKVRKDIRDFKSANNLDQIVVLWTANTEKNFKTEVPTAEALERMLAQNVPLPASVLYGVASLKEGCVYLNGSPQNTVSEGLIELAALNNAFIGGSDFKTGQTKFKSLMSDFFVGSGLRLSSVMSYNHLGNNDGKNLNEPETFRSKEISKAGVLDDAVESNPILYPSDNKGIDHTIVIKYCPFVGDSKRAMDEYTSEIFMNGLFTFVSHATCEDSLLAAPIMLDMILLAEYFTRVKIDGESLGPVLSYLSFFFKAPVTNHPEYVFNSFTRQKETLVNFLKATAGIPIEDSTLIGVKF